MYTYLYNYLLSSQSNIYALVLANSTKILYGSYVNVLSFCGVWLFFLWDATFTQHKGNKTQYQYMYVCKKRVVS